MSHSSGTPIANAEPSADRAHPQEGTLAIRIEGLCRGFGSGANRLEVLKAVHFEARFGDITMLIGPSGCGKTTLLSIIAGTLSPDAGEGRLEVLGQNLRAMSQGALTAMRAKQIGFIFQSFHLIHTLSCAENVAIPLLIQGVGHGRAIRQARDILDRVGLAEKSFQRPTLLSGGQQQRVAIARALVHEPKLILCDEPTAALDARNGALIMELFGGIVREPDRSLIIVTHDNRIFGHADRIASMDDGRIVELHDMDEQHRLREHLRQGFHQ